MPSLPKIAAAEKRQLRGSSRVKTHPRPAAVRRLKKEAICPSAKSARARAAAVRVSKIKAAYSSIRPSPFGVIRHCMQKERRLPPEKGHSRAAFGRAPAEKMQKNAPKA